MRARPIGAAAGAAVVLAAWLAPDARRRLPRPAPAASMAAAPPITARGGEWASPVTSATLVADVVRLAEPTYGPDGALYHAEARPAEGGRTVIVRDGKDVTPAYQAGAKNLNARTRVHEYGGGAYAVLPHPTTAGATLLLFSNFEDQRLWAQTVTGDGGASPPAPLTREAAVPAGLRFADVTADPRAGTPPRAYCVLESHEDDGKEPWNAVGAVDLTTGAVARLTGGAAQAAPASDFVAFPTPSPSGTLLAWVAWNHPSMPWDDTTLFVASVAADGSLSTPLAVAGGADVSVQAPLWLPDGGLAFVSDERSGWWNVWRTAPGVDLAAAVAVAAAGAATQPVAAVPRVNLAPAAAEFGGPVWVHGLRPLSLLSDGRLLVRKADPASPAVEVGLLDPTTPGGALTPLPGFDYAGASRFAIAADAASGGTRLATVATRPDAPTVLVTATLAADGKSVVDGWRVAARAHDLAVDAAYLPTPRVVTFPTAPVPGEAASPPVAHAIYYPPTNPTHTLPPGTAPPLLVKIHGGPTAAAGSAALAMGTVYWTSRGFAVADVNYRGSTSYGRDYRNALRGNWGVADVADVAAVVKHLAAQGLADPTRAVIDGGSAGGFTTLAALAFTDAFAAGTSLYGVADCGLLAADTHKFESRYLDSLIGPYPEAKEVYDKRSPINSVDAINAALLLLQGDEDRIVPPNQAALVFDKLKARGVPTALVMYEGEQHGFRKAENIRSAYDSELWFYGKVLGFKPQGIDPAVRLPDGIANLVSVSVE